MLEFSGYAGLKVVQNIGLCKQSFGRIFYGYTDSTEWKNWLGVTRRGQYVLLHCHSTRGCTSDVGDRQQCNISSNQKSKGGILGRPTPG